VVEENWKVVLRYVPHEDLTRARAWRAFRHIMLLC
jgi:hypothetical protein